MKCFKFLLNTLKSWIIRCITSSKSTSTAFFQIQYVKFWGRETPNVLSCATL